MVYQVESRPSYDKLGDLGYQAYDLKMSLSISLFTFPIMASNFFIEHKL